MPTLQKLQEMANTKMDANGLTLTDQVTMIIEATLPLR
jgi:hypothetical protein